MTDILTIESWPYLGEDPELPNSKLKFYYTELPDTFNRTELELLRNQVILLGDKKFRVSETMSNCICVLRKGTKIAFTGNYV